MYKNGLLKNSTGKNKKYIVSFKLELRLLPGLVRALELPEKCLKLKVISRGLEAP